MPTVNSSAGSRRCWTVNWAALQCALHLWDDTPTDFDTVVKAAIDVAAGETLAPSWLPGALLGALTIDQSHRLGETAAQFAAGDPETVAAIAAVITRAA